MMKQALLGDFTSQATLTDPRRSNRLDHETMGLLLPDVEDAYCDEMEVKVLDVSRHGVGFMSATALPVDARYRIRIGTGPLRLESRLRVVTCRQRGERVFHVGAEFV